MGNISIDVIKTLIGGLILGAITYIYKKNTLYPQIIDKFREKLSRPHHEGKQLTKKDIEKIPDYPKTMEYVTVIDVSTHKTDISNLELDMFYNKLRYFNYSFVLFKKYYKERTNEIMRFAPEPENKNIDLVLLQRSLQKDHLLPIKFGEVLIYHIKYEWKLTSYFYTWKIRKKKRELLREK